MEKRRILLVDDEADFMELMSSRIRSWGYEVIEALTGKDGLSVLSKEKPDIIILDYMLTDMDGIEVLKKIRKVDKKIPVIMFTAYPEMKVIKDTKKLGLDAVVPKYSTYSDVQSALKAAIDMVEKKVEKEE